MTEESNKPIDTEPLSQQEEAVQDGVAEPEAGSATDSSSDLAPAGPESPWNEAAEVPAEVPTEVPTEVDSPSGQERVDLPAETAPGDSAESVSAEEPVAEEAVTEIGSAEPDPVEMPGVEEDKSEPRKMDWYILKVQSNREDSIREGLIRRVKIAGLEEYFGEIIVPTEKVTEFKGGKKRVMKRKLYPGYIVVNMEINQDTWFLVRETPGIGDFTGAAGTPTPMLPHEVQRILAKTEEKQDEVPKLKIGFHVGDRVKINEGTFENFEGEVHTIDETSGRVTVMINIFGRSTPVELEYWQIESV